MKFKTWHIELIIITVILVAVTWIFANNMINWVTTHAILITFQHAQIGDRLQERQSAMNIINWKKVDGFMPEEEVLAINNKDEAIVGYMFQSKLSDKVVCESDDQLIENVKYYITIKDLIKTLPNGR